jgi:hypothetical protein
MSTIAENSEEPNTEEHEGEGSQQLLQSPLHARAGNGSNDPTGAQTVNPEQAHAQTSGTQVPTEPLAAGVPPTETPTVQTSENNDKETETRGKNVGTCQMFSCAMGKRFYQILCIEELRASENDDFEMSFPEDSQIVLTMGGPVCKYISCGGRDPSFLSSPLVVTQNSFFAFLGSCLRTNCLLYYQGFNHSTMANMI